MSWSENKKKTVCFPMSWSEKKSMCFNVMELKKKLIKFVSCHGVINIQSRV